MPVLPVLTNDKAIRKLETGDHADHVRQTWRLLAPYSPRLHLARAGRNPRLVTWVPAELVRTLVAQRPWYRASADQ